MHFNDIVPGPRSGLVTTLLLAVALTVPTAARAQVNIESLRRQDAPQGLSGSLGGDVDITTGNTELVALSANGRLNWTGGAATTLLIGEGGLGFFSGDRFASSGLLHLRRTQWLAESFAVEGFGQLNYDRPLLLDFRALAGAGIRARVARGDWGVLGVGSSLMLEKERLDLPVTATHPTETETLRNSTFVTFRVLGGAGFVVSSTTYAQPALSDVLDDIRIIENFSLSASLTDRLALTTTFDLRYDSGPPDGIAALDTHLKTGLTFTY